MNIKCQSSFVTRNRNSLARASLSRGVVANYSESQDVHCASSSAVRVCANHAVVLALARTTLRDTARNHYAPVSGVIARVRGGEGLTDFSELPVVSNWQQSSSPQEGDPAYHRTSSTLSCHCLDKNKREAGALTGTERQSRMTLDGRGTGQ